MTQSWLAIPDHFPHVRLDEFVIMPNHVHRIIWIVDDSVAATVPPNVPATVPTSVGAKNLSPLRQGSPRISPPVMHTIPATASANARAKNLSPLPRLSPEPVDTSVGRILPIGLAVKEPVHC